MFIFFDLMLAKKYHLVSKDVNYLTKKRQYFIKGNYSFFYVLQYPNKMFHQFSFHVTIKMSKSAVWRNFVRRVVMKYLQDYSFQKIAIDGSYYKVFINLNKNTLTFLQQLIQQKDKKKLREWIIKEFQFSFNSFQTYLCKK